MISRARNGARSHKLTRQVIMRLGLSLGGIRVLMILALSAVSMSVVYASNAWATDGLAPGTPVPAWAEHKFVHFLPLANERAAASRPESSLGGISPLLAGQGGEKLKYWGGPVQTEPKLYLLFWGNNFTNGTEPVTLYTQLKEFYYGLGGELDNPGEEGWQGILTQYTNAKGNYTKAQVVGESYVNNTHAPQELTEAEVLQEITEWSEHGASQNANTQVIVLTAPGTTFHSGFNPYCAYHSIDSQGYSYSLVPYQNAECNYGAGQLHETTGAASHEFAESVTDPSINGETGWLGTLNNPQTEVADLCEEKPAQELPEKNGRQGFWWVVFLWDDEGGNKCSLEDPAYPTPPPPSVTTAGVSSILSKSATLEGSVNPDGPDAHYYFEYGETTSYGNDAPAPPGNDAGYGDNAVPVSIGLSNLTPDTKYYYRLVASSWTGTSYGEDKAFTSAYAPPEVKIGEANELGPTIATVHGEVRATNGAPRTTYFEYGPTTSYGSKTPETKETSYSFWEKVSSHLTGLAPNTVYHYRLVSSTNGGTTDSGDATFKTEKSPEAVTEAPRSVRATSASLVAKINPGGLNTTYQFEYWLTGKSSEIKYLPTVPASAGSGTANVFVAQELTELTTHGSYSYRVKAANGVGTTTGKTETFTATPPFQLEPTPTNIGGTKDDVLTSISCSSPISCMATGGDGNANGMIAGHWTGAEWELQAIPAPQGAIESHVETVSCTSTTECIALGGFENASHETGIAMAGWNGQSWSDSGSVVNNIEGATGVSLNRLSCVPGSPACYAAGTDYPKATGAETPIAAHLSAFGEWENLSLPTLPHNEGAAVTGLSCSAGNACTLIGYYISAPEQNVSFIDRWNGTTWAAEATHLSSGVLDAVSCASASSCMAVGKTGSEPLADYWNGSEWSAVPAHPNGYFGSGQLVSVSCSSANYCVAVGGFLAPIIEAWNGTEWQALSAEQLSSSLESISCVAGSCTAVGFNTENELTKTIAFGLGAPYAETAQATSVSGSSATLHAKVNPYAYETTYQFEYGPTKSYGTRVPATPGKLSAAWRNEALSVTVTGLSGTNYHYRIVATNAFGTTYGQDYTIAPHSWALIPNPTPPGATSWKNTSVSCVSITSCVMVGTASEDFAEFAYSEHWNGTEWTMLTTTLPAGTVTSSLSGVSCSSATACTAVGLYKPTEPSSWHLLALLWNGSAWSVAASPVNPQEGSSPKLEAVSCPTATACTAVGFYRLGSNEDTLAEAWNGTEWKIQSTPNGSGQYNFLTAVSCTSATACMAAGIPKTLYWNGSSWTSQSPVGDGVSCIGTTWCEAVADETAEGWNGSEWKSQSPVAGGYLSAVSCASETMCTANGFAKESTTIEAWNGTEWNLQTPTVPSGFKELQLKALSCPTTTSCIMVGEANNGTGTSNGVVESFGPPITFTEAATSVSVSGATLNASVNANGEATTYRFEYGTTTSYGTSVPFPEGTMASEKAAEHVGQAITGLRVETTYHYRVVATNASGVTDGADHTFKTT